MTEASPNGTRPMVAPELLAALDLFPDRPVNDAFIAAIRSGAVPPVTRGGDLSPEQAAVAMEERFVPGAPGSPDVRLLIYTPPGTATAPRPAILDIHGGGYIMGSADMGDPSNRTLVCDLGCVIVSVDYRLAPETRWPGALEDCYAALAFMHREADTLGIDRSRIALSGGSAGGGHAAALALLARDRGEYAICFQMLHAPMLDDRTAAHPHAGEFIWTAASNRYGWTALLGVEAGGPDVPENAVPARATSLEGLPPAVIVVGALDLFVEEDMDYTRRLIRAGVPTELHVIPGAYHGYGLAGPGAPQVRLTSQLQRDALARAFQIV